MSTYLLTNCTIPSRRQSVVEANNQPLAMTPNTVNLTRSHTTNTTSTNTPTAIDGLAGNGPATGGEADRSFFHRTRPSLSGSHLFGCSIDPSATWSEQYFVSTAACISSVITNVLVILNGSISINRFSECQLSTSINCFSCILITYIKPE